MDRAVVDTRHEYQGLQELYLPIAVGVFVLVLAVVVFAALRFRRRGDGRAPSRRTGAPVVEGLYVLILAGVAALLVGATFTTESREDRSSRPAALDVSVTVAKWRWRFDYPGLGISEIGTDTTPPTLTVPAGTTVRFTMRSQDVIHSFWIPDLRFKRDAFPLRTTRFELVFDRTGFHSAGGACAEYCGLHHGDMSFAVDVLRRAEFDRWAQGRRAGGGTQR